MKLTIDGNVNAYYVQMLCMIFFPGVKFGSAPEDVDGRELTVTVCEENEGALCRATLLANGKTAVTERFRAFGNSETESRDKTVKFAVGAAVLAAGNEILGYRPSWGMLTGVRPSKVAREILERGVSKTRTKRILTGDYQATPKKAQLAIDVALREQQLIGVPDPRDCSLYVSIPFCPSRCSYCSFVSYTSEKLLALIPDYLVRLARELDVMFDEIRTLGLHLKTVYIGGGTPTVLSADQLRFLLSRIAENIDVNALEEFTLESGRPDTITAEKFAVAKQYGVTRVSVNPQSLSEEVLEEIGRHHTVDEFYRAFDVARCSGIPIINTDLIAGLPGDTFRRFAKTLNAVVEIAPENLTVHTFCVKKASDILREGSHVYSLRGGDAGKCVDYAQVRAANVGYHPYYMYRQKNTVGNYENVGFAKVGTDGLYNVYMMEEVHSIFAVGAGAVTKVVHYRVGGSNGEACIRRVANPKYPYEYLRADENFTATRSAVETFYRENGLI